MKRIIIGSDWRPETKQGIEGKIDRFRSERVRVRVELGIGLGLGSDRRYEPDRRSEPNTVLLRILSILRLKSVNAYKMICKLLDIGLLAAMPRVVNN